MLSKRALQLAGLTEHQLPKPLEEKDQKRWLYVTQEIDALLSGNGDPALGFPTAFGESVISGFCQGWYVTVTRQKNVKAHLKWLTGHDEAWVMVFPKPKPGWRLFGRWASKNLFVGLLCLPRGECAPDSVYQQRAVEMIAEWQSRFAADPLRGKQVSDYLGGIVRDLDEA